MGRLRVNHRFLKLIVVLLGLVLIVGLGGSSYRLWKRRDIVAERQTVLTELEGEHAGLKRQLQDAQSEGFVERMAREKLGLVKEGESVVIISNDNPPAGGQMTNETARENLQNVPNWKRWWKLFF
mgnify:CR=1 FL=1